MPQKICIIIINYSERKVFDNDQSMHQSTDIICLCRPFILPNVFFLFAVQWLRRQVTCNIYLYFFIFLFFSLHLFNLIFYLFIYLLHFFFYCFFCFNILLFMCRHLFKSFFCFFFWNIIKYPLQTCVEVCIVEEKIHSMGKIYYSIRIYNMIFLHMCTIVSYVGDMCAVWCFVCANTKLWIIDSNYIMWKIYNENILLYFCTCFFDLLSLILFIVFLLSFM